MVPNPMVPKHINTNKAKEVVFNNSSLEVLLFNERMLFIFVRKVNEHFAFVDFSQSIFANIFEFYQHLYLYKRCIKGLISTLRDAPSHI